MSHITELHEVMKGTFEIDLNEAHNFSDGLYAHKYSHLSILAKGKVLVKTDDFEQEYVAPACIDIKANVNHLIEALEDTVWYCIHATNETDVDKIDEVLISRKD